MTTQKRNTIIYWIATIWLAFSMTTSGIIQAIQYKDEIAFMAALGYPAYFLTIIGVWKILGVIAILAPKYPLVKEWAYAGFFFTMSGAFFSHLAMRDSLGEIFPSVLLMATIVISWYFRPESRKLVSASAVK